MIQRTTFRRAATPAFAAALLVLTACGGDSDSGGGAQSKAAELTLESAESEGVELDSDCVNEVASKLSDEDAQAIVDAGGSGDPELSEAGDALAVELFACADTGALADIMIKSLEETGIEFDEGCVRDKVDDLDASAITADGGVPEEFITAMMECADIGG